MLTETQPQARRTPALLVISVFVLQIFFFTPIQVLSQNFGEFSVSFAEVLIILLVFSLVLIILLYLVMRMTRLTGFLWILAYLGTIAFIESRFFLNLAGHNPFDGKPIDWVALAWLSYLELGVVLALGGLFWVFRRQTQFLSAVSLFILLFLMVGFAYETVRSFPVLLSTQKAKSEHSRYLDQFYRLSAKRNVIHIVPDQAQGAMLHDILRSDYQRYSSVFEGFTLFTDAIGGYPSTYPSVLFYMSGEAPEPEHDRVLVQPYTWEYIDKTLSEGSIVSLLSRNGFRTFGFQFHPGIYCKGPYTTCTGTHDEVFAGVAVETPAHRLTFTILSALDLGFFQMTPIVLREQIYAGGRWRLRNLLESGVTHSGVLDLLTKKMKVEDFPGSYNYIHHAGAHAPLLFDRNCKYIGPQDINQENQREQVLCSLAQMEQLIESLKREGIYDETMIVINGDHGSPWLPPSYSNRSGESVPESLMGLASSLLLIKPFDGRGALEFSSLPVTTGDIPATISDALGLRYDQAGVSVFNADIQADRERQFYTYDSGATSFQLQALKNMTRYRIRGSVFDDHNWVLPVTTADTRYPSQLKVDDPAFAGFTEGFSILEQHDVPMRWVDGTRAKVLLSPPAQDSVVLVIDAYVPSSIEGQWMEISVQGRHVAKLDQVQLRERSRVIPIPSDLSGMELLEIEFTMGKTMSTSADSRKLSILFSYIGLQVAD